MNYATRDAQLNPPDDRRQFERERLEEWCANQGRDVAQTALSRHFPARLEALAWVRFHWLDRSLGEGVDHMVRQCAIDVLLSQCTAAEKALWREILEEGWVDSVDGVRAHCAARRGLIEKGIREGQREGLRA